VKWRAPEFGTWHPCVLSHVQVNEGKRQKKEGQAEKSLLEDATTASA